MRVGDIVVYALDPPSPLAGKKFRVIGIMGAWAALIMSIDPPYQEHTVTRGQLHVIPPEGCFFSYGDKVKIVSETVIYPSVRYSKSPRLEMAGKFGEIRSYDGVDDIYYVISSGAPARGSWFPVKCLVPASFKGETFIYPLDTVILNKESVTVEKVKLTKSGHGQLLYIRGEWVPSSSVTMPC